MIIIKISKLSCKCFLYKKTLLKEMGTLMTSYALNNSLNRREKVAPHKKPPKIDQQVNENNEFYSIL